MDDPLSPAARRKLARGLLRARVWGRFMLVAFREHPLWWSPRLNPDGPGAILTARLAGVRDALADHDADPELDLVVYRHLLRKWPGGAVDYDGRYLVHRAQDMGLLGPGLTPVRGSAFVDEEQRLAREIIEAGGPGAYAAYRSALRG